MNELIPTLKSYLLLGLIVFSSVLSVAQSSRTNGGRPDIPGTLLFEIGVNIPQQEAKNFSTAGWGSRTLNIYYQHHFKLPIFQKKISFVPGIGLGFDRFKFSNNYTIAYQSGNLTMSKIGLDITRSHFITNYLDVPIEFMYTKNVNDPNRSLKLSLGFRTGMLLNAFSKIRYMDDGTELKVKTKRDWDVNNLRYGPYGKIGFGNFSLFAYSNMSTLFKTDKGPDDSNMNTLTSEYLLGDFNLLFFV